MRVPTPPASRPHLNGRALGRFAPITKLAELPLLIVPEVILKPKVFVMQCFACNTFLPQDAVFCHRCGVRLDMNSQPPYPFLISLNHIHEQVSRFRMPSQEQLAPSLHNLPHHGCPNREQWFALIRYEAITAHALIHQLYMRLYSLGPKTETGVLLSIEEYHVVLAYLSTHDSVMLPPKPLWRDYPTETEWQVLAQTDPQKMRRLIALLDMQTARFGTSTPITLTESLETALQILRTISKS